MLHPIEQTLERFRDAVTERETVAPTVSGWSVGEHIHHCCLSMIGISKSLRKSTPPAPPTRPSVPRSAVLIFGFIPRGRAKSPSFVVPRQSVPQAELVALLDQSSTLLREAAALDRASWFSHPFLGTMRRDQALRFVLVHNRHHLRIVRDILTFPRSA